MKWHGPKAPLPILILRSLDDATRDLVRADLYRYMQFDEGDTRSFEACLSKVLRLKPRFRNVFLHRCAHADLTPTQQLLVILLKRSFPPVASVELLCDDVGAGLLILHNFCTVAARSIGRDVVIGPGVVIGKRGNDLPVIEDGAKICANATVIGKVTVGKNAIVGAGAVVIHDVPAGAHVVGNPAHATK